MSQIDCLSGCWCFACVHLMPFGFTSTLCWAWACARQTSPLGYKTLCLLSFPGGGGRAVGNHSSTAHQNVEEVAVQHKVSLSAFTCIYWEAANQKLFLLGGVGTVWWCDMIRDISTVIDLYCESKTCFLWISSMFLRECGHIVGSWLTVKHYVFVLLQMFLQLTSLC